MLHCNDKLNLSRIATLYADNFCETHITLIKVVAVYRDPNSDRQIKEVIHVTLYLPSE